MILVMCYNVPNKKHLKSQFLVIFFKIVVFDANSCLNIELSILFLKLYTFIDLTRIITKIMAIV